MKPIFSTFSDEGTFYEQTTKFLEQRELEQGRRNQRSAECFDGDRCWNGTRTPECTANLICLYRRMRSLANVVS